MPRSRPLRIVALLVALVLAASACAEEESPVIVTGVNPVTAPRDLVGTAERDGFETLGAAIEATGLADELDEDGEYTLFAPSDAAFGDLPTGALQELLEDENQDLLADILRNHVVDGRYTSVLLLDMSEVTTVDGATLTVETLVEAEGDEGLEATATIVVGGEAEVTGADSLATNGVIHEIDAVLVPEDRADDFAEMVANIPEIVDAVSTLEEMGEFETLLELVQSPDLDPQLIGTLTGEGPFTLFAPTDSAFAALPPEKIEQLQAEPELLEAVLAFHVVRGRGLAEAVTTERYFATLEGEGARLAQTGPDSYTFADVSLAETDIVASNGIIHVVDEVLIPDSARGPGGL